MDISREHAIISFAYALQYTISIDFLRETYIFLNMVKKAKLYSAS